MVKVCPSSDNKQKCGFIDADSVSVKLAKGSMAQVFWEDEWYDIVVEAVVDGEMHCRWDGELYVAEPEHVRPIQDPDTLDCDLAKPSCVKITDTGYGYGYVDCCDHKYANVGWIDDIGWTFGSPPGRYHPKTGKMDKTTFPLCGEWECKFSDPRFPKSVAIIPIYSSQTRQDHELGLVTLDSLIRNWRGGFRLDLLLSRWSECVVPFTVDDSRKLGISAEWVVNDFVAGVKGKRIAVGASSVTDDEVLDMDFFEASKIAAYGDQAYGKGKLCPRDDQMDCSIVDGVRLQGWSAAATLFISWVWAYTLRDATSALRNFLRSYDGKKQLFLWWCFFQNNQFRILGNKEKQSFETLRKLFGTQVQSVGRMVCMMDKITASLYSRRLWCLFEVATCVEHHIPMEVMIPEKSQTEVETLLANGFHAVNDAICIDSESAEATMKEDQENIKKLIETQTSYAEVNRTVRKALRRGILNEIARALDSD